MILVLSVYCFRFALTIQDTRCQHFLALKHTHTSRRNSFQTLSVISLTLPMLIELRRDLQIKIINLLTSAACVYIYFIFVS